MLQLCTTLSPGGARLDLQYDPFQFHHVHELHLFLDKRYVPSHPNFTKVLHQTSEQLVWFRPPTPASATSSPRRTKPHRRRMGSALAQIREPFGLRAGSTGHVKRWHGGSAVVSVFFSGVMLLIGSQQHASHQVCLDPNQKGNLEWVCLFHSRVCSFFCDPEEVRGYGTIR